MVEKPKIIVVILAQNSEKTIGKTYQDIPHGLVKKIIIHDDASKDRTVYIAKRLGLETIVQKISKGYGGSQKAAYTEALKQNADVIVMLHADYQYDPKKIPELVRPLIEGKRDIMLGSRMIGKGALRGRMPLWRYVGNKVLTKIENIVLGLDLSEFHTGLRAYNRNFLQTIPFKLNSDDFVFDQQVLIQAVVFGFKERIGEIGIPTRYFKEGSSISLKNSLIYTLDTVKSLLIYILHKYRIKTSKNLIRK